MTRQRKIATVLVTFGLVLMLEMGRRLDVAKHDRLALKRDIADIEQKYSPRYGDRDVVAGMIAIRGEEPKLHLIEQEENFARNMGAIGFLALFAGIVWFIIGGKRMQN